jgi:TatD DNase family protein
MHCYSGDWAHAEQFLALGGYLSFTGILTFPKSGMMQEVARRAPLDRILVETDAPFLAPVPHRGQRNEPAYVEFVAKQLSEIRELASEEIANATTENAKRLLGLK